MLRRTKEDTVNGKKILDLPPKLVEVVRCDFSPAERRFYTTIENRMVGELRKLANSADNRSYMHMLTLLLRARQGKEKSVLISSPRFAYNGFSLRSSLSRHGRLETR